MNRILLDYYKKDQFEFIVEEETEDYITGYFVWSEEVIHKLKEIDEIIESEDEFWYLDEDGSRLEDDELFERSPWSIIEKDNYKKIVQRFMDYSNGKAKFSLGPWFRIGDEFNHNTRKMNNME